MPPDPALTPIDSIAEAFSVDDYLYFYRDFLSAERSESETQAVIAALDLDQSERVLDLACGFGRIANRLARRGFDVTGVELLDGFLDVARAEAKAWNTLVDYRQGDMRRLTFRAEFDAVLMMFNSFGYFSDDENLQVLRGAAHALKPGGRLGMDLIHRDGVMYQFQPDAVTEKDGNLMINRFSVDVWTGRMLNERVFIRDGVRKDRPFSIRLYSLTELRSLLAQAGFRLDGAYAEWDGTPLEAASPAMVIVATRK